MDVGVNTGVVSLLVLRSSVVTEGHGTYVRNLSLLFVPEEGISRSTVGVSLFPSKDLKVSHSETKIGLREAVFLVLSPDGYSRILGDRVPYLRSPEGLVS